MPGTTTPSGNRHTKVFDTKAEADRFLTSVEMSKITGSYVDPNRSKVTVGVLADRWLEAKLDLAPKTRDRYEGIIRAHVRPRWGKVGLSDVTHAEVQRWLARLDLAPATVRKVHRVLSMIMAYAMKDGRLAVNPAAGVSRPGYESLRSPKPQWKSWPSSTLGRSSQCLTLMAQLACAVVDCELLVRGLDGLRVVDASVMLPPPQPRRGPASQSGLAHDHPQSAPTPPTHPRLPGRAQPRRQKPPRHQRRVLKRYLVREVYHLLSHLQP
jgi:hypothetical protein